MNNQTACTDSNGTSLERTRFFPRQLITPDDLTQDQVYFRDKMRRHNRLLHGWGVVCGLRVRRGSGDCEIDVEHGYALSPQGDEILVGDTVTMDLCREDIDGNGVSACGSALDPWCNDIRVSRRPGEPLYIAIRYDECHSRPVRVQSNGCGCAEEACEHSRIREGYALKVLTRLPDHYPIEMRPMRINDVFRCGREDEKGRECPDCINEPWVILATVTLGTDGTVADIDCFSHRRYVASFADFYFMCRDRNRALKQQRAVEMLEDQRVTAEAGKAKMMIALARTDGSEAYLPAYFEVKRGETYVDFLAREGAREYHDPVTGERIMLRDLYAMAHVAPDETLRNVADALAVLEGTTIRVDALNRTREAMAAVVDDAGLKRLESKYGGAPASAETLLASDIKGVSSRSTLGKQLAGKTVADVAGTDRETFIAEAMEGVPDRRKAAMENQAREVWENASAIRNLSRTWKNQ
jgi:hypothetical protein